MMTLCAISVMPREGLWLPKLLYRPPRRRIRFGDASCGALGDLLVANPQGADQDRQSKVCRILPTLSILQPYLCPMIQSIAPLTGLPMPSLTLSGPR